MRGKIRDTQEADKSKPYREVRKQYMTKDGPATRTYYVVDFYESGKRRQKSCSTVEDALFWVEKFKARRDRLGVAFHELSQAQYMDAVRAVLMAKEEKRPDLTLEKAMEIALKSSRPLDPAKTRTVRDAVTELIREAEIDGLRERTINSLRQLLPRLVEAFGDRPVSSITMDEAREWLGSLKREDGSRYSRTTVSHYRAVGHQLFGYALDRGYASSNPFVLSRRRKRRERALVQETVPEVFTLDEVQAIMRVADEEEPRRTHLKASSAPSTVPALALGFFAGIRSEEIARMEWGKHVDLKSRTIHISGDIAKKRSTRRFKMEANLVEWLSKYARESGPVAAPEPVLRYRRRWICETAGVAWKQNAPRHTFGSMHMEAYEDEAKTRKVLGHKDSGVFDQHYKNVGVTHEDAVAYFEIVPSDCYNEKKVINFAKA